MHFIPAYSSLAFSLAVACGLLLSSPAADGSEMPPDVAEAVNLLANPSFEEGSDLSPVDWVFVNQCQRMAGHWVGESARSGRQCVSVEGDGGLAYGRWMTACRLPIEAGKRYRLGFWYKGHGGSVYLLGNECLFDAGSGVLTENLGHAYQTVVVKTEPSDEWRFYTGDFTAPDYPSWARVCLAGGGRETCFFDDVSLVPSGLHLVMPRSPMLCETGGTVTVEMRFEPETAVTEAPVDWGVSTPGLRLVRATADPARKTWRLDLQPVTPGLKDLAIHCRRGGTDFTLTRRNFLRAHPPLHGTFAFAVFTDAHLYRPGVNERNELFGRFTALANTLDPLFALGLGDQMEISSGATDTQKKWIAEAVREQLGRLSVPVCVVAGNHEIDKTVEGAGTRWYQEKYFGQPACQGFEAGGWFFAGIDTTVGGIYGRDHGGGFVHPGQSAWLDSALRSAHERGLPAVLWTHVPPYGEFPDGQERDHLLGLVYSNDVRLVLSGHIHNTLSQCTSNPFKAGRVAPPWPKPETLPDCATAVARLANPVNTLFLTTTTVSAFLLGGSRFNGFLYVWVREGRIAWVDTIPLSLSLVEERKSKDSKRFRIHNGPEKALTGLPLRLDTLPGRFTVLSGGRELPVVKLAGSCWVQVDVPAGGEITLDVRHESRE